MSNNTNSINDNEMDTREQMEKQDYYLNNSESKTTTRAQLSAQQPLMSANSSNWRSTSGTCELSMGSTQSSSEAQFLSNSSVGTIGTSFSSSLINFQMPQNFLLPQVMPNFPNYLPSMSMPSMPSLPDYLTQLPTLPTVSMPSMPNLSMPSMPNISMPSMPNLPSISSLSDFMSNYLFIYLYIFLLILKIFSFKKLQNFQTINLIKRL
jgi:hypothetical protein